MAQFETAFDLLLDLVDNKNYEFPNAITAVLQKYPKVSQVALTLAYDEAF